MAKKKRDEFSIMPLRQELRTDKDRMNYVVDALSSAATYVIRTSYFDDLRGRLTVQRLRRALEAIEDFGKKEPTKWQKANSNRGWFSRR